MVHVEIFSNTNQTTKEIYYLLQIISEIQENGMNKKKMLK